MRIALLILYAPVRTLERKAELNISTSSKALWYTEFETKLIYC